MDHLFLIFDFFFLEHTIFVVFFLIAIATTKRTHCIDPEVTNATCS